MLNRLRRTRSPLDLQIDTLLLELNAHTGASEEHAKIMSEVERLYKLKAQEAGRKISPDTMLVVSANLAGIFLIIRHENVNVITSKALGFVNKPKA